MKSHINSSLFYFVNLVVLYKLSVINFWEDIEIMKKEKTKILS